ncbi:uncharacterized protein LOC115681035 [Syzygium oleosum]|uniref:uncharacterized protein LOC115681035 n=1 Tax=Syzygium oleosum TaxID=219896 RepID=UPI0011D1866A|nr:uncharacterized protein LOC115681035 [Syzygium oleosum]
MDLTPRLLPRRGRGRRGGGGGRGQPLPLQFMMAVERKDCNFHNFHPPLLDGASLVSAPTPLAEYAGADAQKSYPESMSTAIVSVDSQSQLEGTNDAVTQGPSPQLSPAPLLLPAPEQGIEEVPLLASSPSTSQMPGLGSSSSIVQSEDTHDFVIVDVQGSSPRVIPPIGPALMSSGDPSSTISSSSQPMDQIDAGKSLGSSAKAKLTLERAARALHSEAIDSSSIASEPSSAFVITKEVAKAKWTEFLELSKGGYLSVAANPAVTKKLKTLLNELCGGDIRFSKSTSFKKRCEDFLTEFLDGVETYQQNCEKIAVLVVSEKDFQYSHDSVEEINHTLKTNQSILQALVDERTNLAARKVDLEKQLAEVRHQQKFKDAKIARADKVLWNDLDTFDTLMGEKNRLDKKMADQRQVRNQLQLEISHLDHSMSTFQGEVRDFVNNM